MAKEENLMLKRLGLRLKANRSLVRIKPLLLPVLLSIFPTLFHYGNNVNIVTLPSLYRTTFFFCIVSVAVYFVFLVLKKGDFFQASNAAFIFMVFFNIYGAVYAELLKKDIFPLENYTWFPLFLLIAIYASWFISKFKPNDFWNTAIFITTVMVAFNIIKIVPAEIKKYKLDNQQTASVPSKNAPEEANKYPDIYYFMFDEFASFDTMRTYWNYKDIDEFASFLTSKGFYVAEKSQGSSIDTLHLMSERLNYQSIDLKSTSLQAFYAYISHNQVMDYLKSKGYTIVIFSEINFGYPAMPPIEADYSFTYGSNDVTEDGIDAGILFDDFGMLVTQSTMMQILNLPNRKTMDPLFTSHKDMIYFTQSRVTNLTDMPSPKFVYVHLLLPHYPFMFQEDGNLNKPEGFYNWNNYLGNYKFTLSFAKKIVIDLIRDADPKIPPVIILQSDHGPRNIVVDSRGGIPLDNFPEELKTQILNALYLPGCNTSDLTQEMNPINTFPLVFNCYFNAKIPLQ